VGYNFYSAPYGLRGKSLDVRITASFLEIFYDLDRVAIHKKFADSQRGRYVTTVAHLPEAHKAILEATPQNIIESAKGIGIETETFVSNLLTLSSHPLRYLRRAQAITTRLKHRYGCEKLEYACKFFNSLNAPFTKLSELEKLAVAYNSDIQQEKIAHEITRKPNSYLRGSEYWGEH
jgi:hypothetical protein